MISINTIISTWFSTMSTKMDSKQQPELDVCLDDSRTPVGSAEIDPPPFPRSRATPAPLPSFANVKMGREVAASSRAHTFSRSRPAGVPQAPTTGAQFYYRPFHTQKKSRLQRRRDFHPCRWHLPTLARALGTRHWHVGACTAAMHNRIVCVRKILSLLSRSAHAFCTTSDGRYVTTENSEQCVSLCG